jgi:hypothetical protein
MEDTSTPPGLFDAKRPNTSVCMRQRGMCEKLGNIFRSESQAMNAISDDVKVTTGLPFHPVICGKGELQALVGKVTSSFDHIEFTLDDFACSESTNLFCNKFTFSGKVKDRTPFQLPEQAQGKMVCFSGALHAKGNETDQSIKSIQLFLEAFSLRQLGIKLDALATPSPGQESAAAGLR